MLRKKTLGGCLDGLRLEYGGRGNFCGSIDEWEFLDGLRLLEVEVVTGADH